MKKKNLIFGLLVALLLASGITLSLNSKASASGCSYGNNVCSKVVVVEDDESIITVYVMGNRNQ